MLSTQLFFLTAFGISLLLLGIPSAVAGYKPPSNQRPPRGNTTTTGIRGGCEENSDTSLTLLAPYTHVGQTTTSHPTFAWFMPEASSFPIEFKLYEYDVNDSPKLVYEVKLVSVAGVTKFTLPQQTLGLTKDKDYVWQVTSFCDPNYSVAHLSASATIELVEMPRRLHQQLLRIPVTTERVNLYAENGLWYDALQEAIAVIDSLEQQKTISYLLETLATSEEQKQSKIISN